MIDPTGSQARSGRILARALLPTPFPFRRDIALEARVLGEGCGFADHHWVSPSVLAVAVASCRGRTLRDAAAATLLRELLRAACRLHVDARSAVDGALGDCRAVLAQAVPIDCALLIVDLSSRIVDAAIHGNGGFGAVDGDRSGVALSPGHAVLLHAGLAHLTVPAADGHAGPREILDATLAAQDGASPSGAVVALVGGPLRPPAHELTLVLANASGEVEEAQRRMEAFLKAREVPDAATAALALVFDELFTNIVSYAFPDGQRHEIVVRVDAGPDDLGLELRDDGIPFDPLSTTTAPTGGDLEEHAIGGLGISFARQLADVLHYDRKDGWNVLRWRKRRAQFPQDAEAGGRG